MKVPLSWLREYVAVEHSVEDLAHRLTMAGTEVGAQETGGSDWDGIVVGRVTEIRRHPNADRLSLVTVDLGGVSETVVSGAPNLAVGMVVPFAPVGATLIDGHTGQRIQLRAAAIRGVTSRGMVCSEKELGLSDDHSGILALDPEAPVGRPLREVLGDTILDLEVTPNRPDLLGVLGVAREVAALAGKPLRLPPEDYPEAGAAAAELTRVDILDPDLCPRYVAAIVEGVRIGPSPWWMRRRLEAVGVRPINLVVDITNYVMMEYGQPLHAFDFERLRGRRIVVRRARPGERMTTLDGEDRWMPPDALVICDGEGPVAVAGVMGGMESEVTLATRTILLEAANFQQISIRRTSRALKLRTEASLRFDKGLAPSLPPAGARRAVRLMVELGGGRAFRGMVDAYPGRRDRAPIPIGPAEVRRVLGLGMDRDTLREALGRFGIACEDAGEDLLARPPDHRTDLTIPADLVEEVARLVGYDHIPTLPLCGPIPDVAPDGTLAALGAVREVLAGCGLQEVITYTLIGDRQVARLGEGTVPRGLRLLNPLSAEQDQLRTTLRASLLDVAVQHQRQGESTLRLFEVGRVFMPRPGDLPEEREMVGIVLSGERGQAPWAASPAEADLFDLKGIVEELFRRLGVEGLRWERGHDPHLHPGACAVARRGAETLAVVGEVHPGVAAGFGLRTRAFLAEADVHRLMVAARPRNFQVSPLPRFPAVRRDLSLVVAEGTTAAELEASLRQAGEGLLAEARLFDVYRGDRIAPGTVSYAYALSFQAADRTLTDAEVDAVEARIVAALRARFGATLRGPG
jgi:phenylalanyl-tRNA synthetase beta chain